ncbi:hypothetical protein BH10PLA1_BH10PLA1_01530 [soil metagenome]
MVAETASPSDCHLGNPLGQNEPDGQTSKSWTALCRDGKSVAVTEKDFGPDLLNDYVIDFIVIDFIGRKKNEPFFVYYPMTLVHSHPHATPDGIFLDSANKRIQVQFSAVPEPSSLGLIGMTGILAMRRHKRRKH